ncbi:MAG TPA: hypothetical protein VFZ66_24445 [Herpetosiphonaceae bacterium]
MTGRFTDADVEEQLAKWLAVAKMLETCVEIAFKPQSPDDGAAVELVYGGVMLLLNKMAANSGITRDEFLSQQSDMFDIVQTMYAEARETFL